MAYRPDREPLVIEHLEVQDLGVHESFDCSCGGKYQWGIWSYENRFGDTGQRYIVREIQAYRCNVCAQTAFVSPISEALEKTLDLYTSLENLKEGNSNKPIDHIVFEIPTPGTRGSVRAYRIEV